MRIVFFTHSLRSDWNHGNAHFLRGVAVELQQRGHTVDVYEPADSWSARNLADSYGEDALDAYREKYPSLQPHVFDSATLDLSRELESADLVLVHEWNDAELVARLGDIAALIHLSGCCFTIRTTAPSPILLRWRLTICPGTMACSHLVSR